MPIYGRGVRTLTGGRSVWRAEVVAQAILARRVVAPYGMESVLLTLIWKWAAAGKRHLPLRAQRALKEGVVIRKRQGEPWFPLLLCACGA